MDRPIIFSAPMVRAILEGRKTQTRRIIKVDISAFPTCPYGKPGDRLWVRETWGVYAAFQGSFSGNTIQYRADMAKKDILMPCPKYLPLTPIKWKPSIHMPRWALRITLEVTQVRFQRLQEISEKDALDEGIKELGNCSPPNYSMTDKQFSNGRAVGFPTAIDAFNDLWESINGPGSWDKNPWVWAITFKRITP